MHRYHERANAIHPYNNPRNPVNPDSKPGLQAYQNQTRKTGLSHFFNVNYSISSGIMEKDTLKQNGQDGKLTIHFLKML